jgi:soluble epoxide hydrolase/lipid-phosphate phosphatase
MASIAFPAHAKAFTVSDGTHYGYINIIAQPGNPTLLFLHGYPSSSYHWHNQVQQCISAGYGMIAPDLLGYGDTSKPTEIAAYDNTILASHIMEILDKEKLSSVIGIGHDWGSAFLSVVARLHPKRFSMLVFLSVGYSASQAALTDVDAINEMVKGVIGRPIFGYWTFHNRADAADIIESADVRTTPIVYFSQPVGNTKRVQIATEFNKPPIPSRPQNLDR